MKICFLTAATTWGGVEIHTVALARVLAARGHSVSIYELGNKFYEGYHLGLNERVQVTPLEIPGSVQDMTFFPWLDLFRKLDGTICVFPKSAIEAGSLRLDIAARWHFHRYITIEHLGCPPFPPSASKRYLRGMLPRIGLWWFRTVVKRWSRSIAPHRVVCVSRAMEKQLIEHYGFSQYKTTTIHNGVNPDIFQRSSEAGRNLRDTYGIPENALVIGGVGRLHPRKGYDVALQAFGELVSQMPDYDIRFLLVGDGPMRDTLERMVCDMGLQDRVTLAGFTNRPWEAYSALDVFVMSSSYEGLPLALLEAMSCGCCPIAMAARGIPEILTDASLGWLVEPGDRSAFLAAMRAAVQSSPEIRSEIGRKTREHIVKNFNSNIQIPALVEFLEKTCDGLRHQPSSGVSRETAPLAKKQQMVR